MGHHTRQRKLLVGGSKVKSVGGNVVGNITSILGIVGLSNRVYFGGYGC
jgi:hypothetical protein